MTTPRDLYARYQTVKRENSERETEAHHALLDSLNAWAEGAFGRDPQENGDLEIGIHSCNDSPIGVCLYDADEDPCFDECLVCGEPEERK